MPPARARSVALRIFPVSVFLEGVPEPVAASLVGRVEREGGGGVLLPGGRSGVGGAAALLTGGLESILAGLQKAARDETNKGAASRAAGPLSRVADATSPAPAPIDYQGKRLDFSGRPLIMGVLNITPDSFSDGGRYLHFERAVERASQMIAQGADILDLGPASSRPGSDPVPDSVQEERLLPVLREIREGWNGWISVDTPSSRVARAAVDAGADMINDISAGCMDPAMKDLAALEGVPVVLMHMKGTPKTMQQDPVYDSLFSELVEYFDERIGAWTEAGVLRERILVDPGIGFGKALVHNLLLLKHLGELRACGRPIVLGTSRKAFIGAVLKRDAGGRLLGTLATLAIGAWNGAHIMRVHDVAEAREVLAMVQAIRETDMRQSLDGRAEAGPAPPCARGQETSS
ncbi:MAG: dihydropteroate synthase [bacterium]